MTTIWDSTYAENRNLQGLTADMSAAVFEIVDPANVPVYSILEGNSSVYVLGSDKGLSFRFDGPLEKFMHLEIDGLIVPSMYYTLKEGSTIVTLNPAYLDQMEAGTHTMTAHYTDGGRAVAVFSIQPKLQDDTNGNDADNDAPSESKGDAPAQRNDSSTGSLPATGDAIPLASLFGICFVMLGLVTALFFCARKTHPDK